MLRRAIVALIPNGAAKMTWFEVLMGFKEKSPDQVRSNLILDGDRLTSRVNGMTFRCGTLETPSLQELRDRVANIGYSSGQLTLKEVVGNVQDLHADVSNAGAIFQVASQFNLLEMVSPEITPEHGVGMYDGEHTQGPACAVAAGAGAIYRNYFAVVNGYIGQSSKNQIDCLADIGEELDNTDNRLWEMKNGYVLASKNGLTEISERLQNGNEKERDELRRLLHIGIQSNTQVTIFDSKHTVTQAYCSALPVAYSKHASQFWENFARLVLEASYEAAMCAAILNAADTGNNKVFLTLLGGGAFGNDINWIGGAIQRVLHLYEDHNLEVGIVSYGKSKQSVRDIVDRFSKHQLH